MARPLKIIDEDAVRKLASIQCSYEEMAAVLKCDPKTLSNRFSQAIKEGRSQGRMSLKRKQYEMAMGGNITMLIWLGKQYLEQSDKVDQKVETKDVTNESKELADKIIKAAKLC